MLTFKPAAFYQRCAALIYDLIILSALLIISTLIIILVFNHGKAIPPGNRAYQCFLIVITFCYFIGFWYKSGQTTGMAAFRLKLLSSETVNKKDNDKNNNDEIKNEENKKQTIFVYKKASFAQLLLRVLIAIPSFFCLGIGFFYCLIDKKKGTFYDKLSKTQVVQIS